MMAEDLDISSLAAEMILQALRPVVHEHYAIEEVGAELDELDIDGDSRRCPVSRPVGPGGRRRNGISHTG